MCVFSLWGKGNFSFYLIFSFILIFLFFYYFSSIGVTSPVWLITTSKRVGEEVIRLAPIIIKDLLRRQPDSACAVSWRDYGEVVLVQNREEMAQLSDLYAAEHLEVHCDDLDWYLNHGLHNYGSLFLGEETCVSYGDKCTGL